MTVIKTVTTPVMEVTKTAESLKVDRKGRLLIPTPTNDQKDPLNWPLWRKSVCLIIVIYGYFMLTYFTTTIIPSFGFLEEQLGINYSQVSWSFALPCLGLATSPLLLGALADIYGRRPALIASTALAVVASGCTSIKTINFGGYMAARFFQGFGAGPSANIGLVIIHDISFEHERGLRVGMWTIAANTGTVLGGVCNVTTLVPDAYPNDSPVVQGLLLIGLLVGLLVAEFVCSGNLSDMLIDRLAKKNGNVRVPEMRLWLGYPAAVISSVGLVLWGLSVDQNMHWMVGQVAFFFYALGLQMGNTVLSAYIVDNYPEHANEVITFYTVIINISAFINPWFIYYWVEGSGYTWTFAAQCIICTFGLIPLYILLHIYGPQLRNARPMYNKHIEGLPATASSSNEKYLTQTTDGSAMVEQKQVGY
ncbi:putative MFS transporter [Talaromyces proteolyticus]|uniref:MFS transporter n=1 Tax=Talaromyces proteolyticus TaxID=1131652 RepID=A0AAD4KNS8_9EURO|nr:putative MFS transporter [Talaromyces proteolyticus]KAH8692165.1 putative MFS transporter [Talaromyces proteolyticus]